MYIHAGRLKHLQQSEQGGLYSPCEWLSVSFVVGMWMGQMNARGNEQRRAEGNRSGDPCITFVLRKWSPRTPGGPKLDVTMRAHIRISPGLNLSLKQCWNAGFFSICHKSVCKILDFFFSPKLTIGSILFIVTRGKVPHFLKCKLTLQSKLVL